MSTEDKQAVHKLVRRKYAGIASGGGGCCGPQSTCCGGGGVQAVAEGVGYTDAELATLPEGANLGLSCGNPLALAGLRPGETVLDLGSGGGLDVFLAAQRVGPTGRAIGVDMTPEMLERAGKNALAFTAATGLANVEFHHGQIEAIPLPDASVDVVISNCVLNLSPDQGRVWKEIARVLKPGGRAAISDMLLLQPLPEAARRDVEALVGCIAGAALVEEVRAMVLEAGLTDLRLDPKDGAVDAMLPEGDPMTEHLRSLFPAGARARDYIDSFSISARKP